MYYIHSNEKSIETHSLINGDHGPLRRPKTSSPKPLQVLSNHLSTYKDLQEEGLLLLSKVLGIGSDARVVSLVVVYYNIKRNLCHCCKLLYYPRYYCKWFIEIPS